MEQERAPAAPAIDPEKVAARLAAAAMGTSVPDPKPPPPAYVRSEDPEIMAAREAVRLTQELRREEEARRARQVNNPRADYRQKAQGRIPVEMMVDDRPDFPDPMRMEDEAGNLLIDPTKEVGRWVRVKDTFDQRTENTMRVRRLRQAYSAEPVLLPDGKQLRTETLVAMKMPIRERARMEIHAAASGAHDTAKQMDHLYNEADRINSDFSRRHHGAARGIINVAPTADMGREAGEVYPFRDPD